jgi:RNA-directed DNA polymerase
VNIGEMQRKLSIKAEKSPSHKFADLYSLLCDQDWLRLAHDYVKQNAGSKTAGCDGINMKLFDENLEENLLDLIRELKQETFEPYPVRRVYIPKTNGKLRKLGIPSIKDRIVQEAVRMILEPIYEVEFSQYSFGFRPNRCTMDAIKAITWNVQESKKYFWIIEGDISSYFDTINHRILMKILRRRIKDEKLLDLIWKFLRAGVMERTTFKDTKLGTPQGGIASPLLANIYLNELDKYMFQYTGISQKEKTKRRQSGLANYAYIRYCDDFVVLCNGSKEQAESLREELYTFLREKLLLNLSKEKTKVTHINDGFKFLGFKIERQQGHNGMKTKILIPDESVNSIIEKIDKATSSGTHNDSVNSKILALNRIIGGWCRYYQFASITSKAFSRIEYTTFWRMTHWLGRKFQLSKPEVLKRFCINNVFTHDKYKLVKATSFKTLHYQKRFLKPNPYTTQEKVQREEIFLDNKWTGYERRPGMTDIRQIVLERDGYVCQLCDKAVISQNAHVDHIRPFRKFKLPVNANRLDNLWTICKDCHVEKTKIDLQMESRMH